jgi:hypothetical protein
MHNSTYGKIAPQPCRKEWLSRWMAEKQTVASAHMQVLQPLLPVDTVRCSLQLCYVWIEPFPAAPPVIAACRIAANRGLPCAASVHSCQLDVHLEKGLCSPASPEAAAAGVFWRCLLTCLMPASPIHESANL